MNESIQKWYDRYAGEVTALSDAMFQNCELGMDTWDAAKRVAAFMRDHGFAVEEIEVTGKGDTPNGVVARFGSGKPVIGILGELDGLPGLGNKAVPYQAPVPEGNPGPGHGCGHHLMGAGCAAAAAALKSAMEEEKLAGTVVYYGCPAEETIEGKIHMARGGLFDELDLCFAWHPMGGAPTAVEASLQANINLYFHFYGKTAHAAANPADGRSALDAAELMNVGVNYLREHVTDDVRMHYSYISAGEKPNIVADYACLQYFVRAKSIDRASSVLERVKACAEGAALMTGTTTKNTLFAAACETFINHTLNRFMYRSAQAVPELAYSEEDRAFARELYKNVTGKEPEHDLLPTKMPEPTGVVVHQAGSTDVGDVSHIVPTTQLFGGGGVTGLPSHHWSTTAATGSPLGHKAELYAGKVLAQTALDAFKNPSIVEEAWAEFREARKGMAPYKPGLPD